MRKSPVFYGLILGLAIVVISYILQIISAKTYMVVLPMVIFALVGIFGFKSAVDKRHRNEGYLSFGDGFLAAITTAAIGTTIYCVFEYILFTFINPELPQAMMDAALDIAEGAFTKLGEVLGENAELDKAMEEIRSEPEIENFNITPTLLFANIFGNLVWPGAIVSLIVGLITKRTFT